MQRGQGGERLGWREDGWSRPEEASTSVGLRCWGRLKQLLGLPRIRIEADPGADRRGRPALEISVVGVGAAAAAAVPAAGALLLLPVAAIAVSAGGATPGGVAIARAVAAVPSAVATVRSALGTRGGGAAGAVRRRTSVERRLVPYRGGIRELSLAESQQRPRLAERRKRVLHGDNRRDVREARVETTKAIEDKCLVGDGGANVAESIGERLQTVAVSGDGELALDEAAELCLKTVRVI